MGVKEDHEVVKDCTDQLNTGISIVSAQKNEKNLPRSRGDKNVTPGITEERGRAYTINPRQLDFSNESNIKGATI